MPDCRRPHGFIHSIGTEYLNGPVSPTPQIVLSIPARVERMPSLVEDNIQRILIVPNQRLSVAKGKFEEFFRRMLAPHSIQV
jgi:hypothetical protein